MPWWAWLLVIWCVLALAGGLCLGAAVDVIRRRERARQEASIEQEWRALAEL
jgi:hypothetical protein